jgi:hypothetical protein
MVKFLLQHALALDDKEEEGNLDDPWSWPRRNSQSPVDTMYEHTNLVQRSQVAESIIQDMRMRRN